MKSALAILAICVSFNAPAAAPPAALRPSASLRMDATAANVMQVRAALRAAVSEDEKIPHIHVLGGLYTTDNASGMNEAIERDLRELSASPSRRIARSATFPLAQIVGGEETLEILLHARHTGLMAGEEIAGELARALRSAPREQQLRYVQLIAAEQSRYGVDVLVMSFGSDLLDPMLPETREAIGELLRHTRIDFPRPIGEFGYGDAIRYANWLHATAVTGQWVSRRPYADTVLAHLDDPQTDPRKLVAYLATPEGKRLMARVGKRGPLAGAVRRASVYADSFPSNRDVKKLVDDIVGAWRKLPA